MEILICSPFQEHIVETFNLPAALLKFVYGLEFFSQVSNVAHGPLAQLHYCKICLLEIRIVDKNIDV